jgi:hypothetical protein
MKSGLMILHTNGNDLLLSSPLIKYIALRVKMMKTMRTAVLASLLAFTGGTAWGQALDQVDTLPISMQAQIGSTTEIKCQGTPSIPFTPTSGSTTQLKCGDWVTILGAHESSYVVRTNDNSTGYLPATALPTDPCWQTRFRSLQFRKQWMPKFKSMNKDEFWQFRNQLYLKVTQDDISVAYKCLSQSMDREEGVGGMNEYMNSLNILDTQPQTLSSDARWRLIKFTEALDFQVDALNLLDDANTAQNFDYARRYDELVDRYNALVDKHNGLISFVDQKMRDLNSVSPPAPQTQTSTWRRILAGTLQGIASYTPPKHIVCDTNGDISLHGDALQPGYVYLNGNLNSHTECREQ